MQSIDHPLQNTSTPATKKPTKRRIPTSPGTTQSQLRVRQIQESLLEEGQNDQAEKESVDPGSALYIRELTEDWADVNHITPKAFNPIKNTTLNKLHPEEKWVETTTAKKQTVAGSRTQDPQGAF